MHHRLSPALLAATILMSAPAHAAAISEARAIDPRAAKVQQDGVINLRVSYGAAPSLTLHGEKADLARVTVRQSGDTLTIDTDDQRHRSHRDDDRGEVRAELILPRLTDVTSRGVGSTTVQGYSADQLRMTLAGAGAMTVNGQYRAVTATLGGVGSMTLNAGKTERIDLNLQGAGHIALNGQSKLLKASLGGVGALDARKLRADAVQLDMSGLGGATVYAVRSADLTLTGLGSATVVGKPAIRNADARGLGRVSWE